LFARKISFTTGAWPCNHCREPAPAQSQIRDSLLYHAQYQHPRDSEAEAVDEAAPTAKVEVVESQRSDLSSKHVEDDASKIIETKQRSTDAATQKGTGAASGPPTGVLLKRAVSTESVNSEARISRGPKKKEVKRLNLDDFGSDSDSDSDDSDDW